MHPLKGNTDLSYETGYLMYYDGSYGSITGVAGQAEINIGVTMPLNGYIHSHYTGLMPIFSGSDVRAIYQLKKKQDINDLTTFTAGVVTDDGTTYLMKVKDTIQFNTFAQAHLNTDAEFQSFEIDYNANYTAYRFTDSNVIAYEKALLTMLKNSGIEIFKGNSNFDSWDKLTLNDDGTDDNMSDDTILITNCNN